MNETIINTFIERKAALKKFYQKLMKKGRNAVYQKYGNQKGDELINQFWLQFEELIPEMPVVRKDDQLLERQIILQTVYLSIYKTLKKEGKKVEDIWNLCEAIVGNMLESLPGFVKKMVRKNLFSKKEMKREMLSARLSQESGLAEDFVFEYVKGEEGGFEYGINMTQCAACKFYKRMGAEELTQYICQTDFLYAKHYGYILERTKTLAGNHDYCDFRFIKQKIS